MKVQTLKIETKIKDVSYNIYREIQVFERIFSTKFLYLNVIVGTLYHKSTQKQHHTILRNYILTHN